MSQVNGVTTMVAAWAEQEVESVDLGDERLDARMAVLLSDLGNHPNLSIPAACKGHAEMQAAYRFFDNDKVSFRKVLAPHVGRTLRRMAGHETVLLVQDSSEIDLTRPEREVAGAGRLDQSRRGVLLHALHGFTPDGTPLGTAWARCLNRTGGKVKETSAQRIGRLKRTAIEKKESVRRLEGLRQARAIAAQLPQTHFTCVGDSESDIYELFAEPRGTPGGPGADWLIRACQDRALDPKTHDEHRRLLDGVSATPVLYEVELLIRGRKAKVAADKSERHQPRKTRKATVRVRAATMTLRPPWRAGRKLPAVTVNVVLVRETSPPAGEPPVQWILITTLPIGTLEEVRRVVEYYCVRWNIEILFRTLKSGCRIEQRRFEQVERVSRCLALYLIVAWRTLFVCRMGRETPDADCEALFEASEWKAVWTAVHGKKPPGKMPRLGEMVHLIAQLGGYIQRPDSEPGPQAMWVGLQRMYDLAWAWDTFGPGTKIRDA
jgi:hypothetical protein